MSNKEFRMVIDDGTREIPLVNKFGKLICNIYIRPGDLSIFDRYKELTNDFADIVEPVKSLSLKDDGTVAFEEEWDALKKVEAELKARINALFDIEEADAIFAKRNPFSNTGNGKFYCENVVNALGNIIAKAVEDDMAHSEQRLAPYLEDLKDETATGDNE